LLRYICQPSIRTGSIRRSEYR